MCSVIGCEKAVFAKGWCGAHYAKWRKYGDPLVVKQAQLHGKTLRGRFEQYTKKSEGCWLWIGHRDPNGYGRLNVQGVPMLAHRLSWTLHNGDVGDAYVLHKCDNPQCVSPWHLFLGTQSDNCDDMWQKGRARPGRLIGAAHGMAKLNDESAMRVRSDTRPLRIVASEYGISESTARDIRNGKTWKHIKETP
jgi:hypothetical protein